MFDHIGIGVSDLAASKAFYLEALAPLARSPRAARTMAARACGRTTIPATMRRS